MRTDVSLRRARPEDAAAIARVHVETWRTAYPGLVPAPYLVAMTERRQTRQWTALLRDQDRRGVTLVAQAPRGAASSVVGFGSAGRARDRADLGEIYALYVAPDWQGHGIGRDLTTALFRALLDLGLPSAIVWVLSANPARFFYEAMGGVAGATRSERFANQDLPLTGYVWSDLDAWVATHGG